MPIGKSSQPPGGASCFFSREIPPPAFAGGVRGRAREGGAPPTVVIRTYKSGKFGRFIVDLWHLPGETDKEKILSQGLFLNQDLLDKGLAEKME